MIEFEMPSSLKTPFIEVFYQAGNPPFICGVNGNATTSILLEIEEGLSEDEQYTFDKGDGNYLFKAVWVSVQYDGEGRCELPPYWNLDLVSFSPNAQADCEKEESCQNYE